MHSTFTSLIVSVLATSSLAAQLTGFTDVPVETPVVHAAAAASTGVHSVKVGPGLVFTPDTVTAAAGDWVEFTFGSGHSVAQSTFDAPCVPLNGDAGVYSGFPNDGDVWRFQVNDTKPIWLYCSKAGHCENGMSLVVNAPNGTAKTLAAYKEASANATSKSPTVVQGGVFGAASASNSTSSSGSGETTGTATGSASTSSSTGNEAPANFARNGLVLAGMVAAGVAAVL